MVLEKPWWTDISDPEYIVTVGWERHDSIPAWNETCSKVLEVFGLPGQRFYYRPKEDYMIFMFKSIKDARLCRILLSECL